MTREVSSISDVSLLVDLFFFAVILHLDRRTRPSI